jgi:uncharacterized protein (TIGR02246 family)
MPRSSLPDTRHLSVLVALAGFISGCHLEPRPPARAEPPPPHEAVARAMDRYASLVRNAPPESVVTMYTPDGELLEPGMDALRGREAILAFLKPLASAVTVESSTMATDTVSVHGTIAYQWGHYDQRAGEKGKPARDYSGRYVAEWHQDGDGTWRIARLLMQPGP